MFLSRLDLDKNLIHFIDREFSTYTWTWFTYIIYVVNILQFMRRGGNEMKREPNVRM